MNPPLVIAHLRAANEKMKNGINLAILGVTRATSSLIAGIETIGTNTAHSMRLSCPRISVLSAADSMSVICAVCRKVKRGTFR